MAECGTKQSDSLLYVVALDKRCLSFHKKNNDTKILMLLKHFQLIEI